VGPPVSLSVAPLGNSSAPARFFSLAAEWAPRISLFTLLVSAAHKGQPSSPIGPHWPCEQPCRSMPAYLRPQPPCPNPSSSPPSLSHRRALSRRPSSSFVPPSGWELKELPLVPVFVSEPLPSFPKRPEVIAHVELHRHPYFIVSEPPPLLPVVMVSIGELFCVYVCFPTLIPLCSAITLA
jgi:hypothetical protein